MTGLEFLSATIGQFVWPALIVVLIFVFKSQIKQIAASPRLKRLKAGPSGIEVEFREELEEAERNLAAAEEEKRKELGPADQESGFVPSNSFPALDDFRAEMAQLADVSPRSVVLESHTRLEGYLRAAVEPPDGENPRRFANMRTLGKWAVANELLTPSEASVLPELLQLRNRVAHEPDHVITRESALQYADLVADVAIALDISRERTNWDGPLMGN